MMRWLALILILLAAPAVGQSRATPKTFSQDDLRKAEIARDAALARLRTLESASAAAARDASLIDADLVAAAADATAREEAAYAAEEQLMLLADESRAASEKLARDQVAMDDLLASLMTFASRRPPALATSPHDVSRAIRAAILMSDAAPALNKRAENLRQLLADISGLADATRAQQANLDAATSALSARREEIVALAEEKRRAAARIDAEAASARTSANKLAAEADTLRDLLASLAKSAPPPPSVKPKPPASTAAKPPAKPPATSPAKPPPATAAPKIGAPVYPVVGSPLKRFGRTIEGQKQEGLTFAARPGATVIAPQDARVQYAGLFRTYGQMVILDVGGDVLVVAAGMQAIYPEAGQWVLAGEPIGRMSDQKSPSPELYLEVRRKGQPVDPETWLGRRS